MCAEFLALTACSDSECSSTEVFGRRRFWGPSPHRPKLTRLEIKEHTATSLPSSRHALSLSLSLSTYLPSHVLLAGQAGRFVVRMGAHASKGWMEAPSPSSLEVVPKNCLGFFVHKRCSPPLPGAWNLQALMVAGAAFSFLVLVVLLGMCHAETCQFPEQGFSQRQGSMYHLASKCMSRARQKARLTQRLTQCRELV